MYKFGYEISYDIVIPKIVLNIAEKLGFGEISTKKIYV